MLPNFDITLNVYVFLLFVAIAGVVGFLPRKKIMNRTQRKIAELEREMVQAHAELLESQSEYCKLEARMKEFNSPVISMKSTKLEENTTRPTGTD
jgi:F0F1-type ATP synthase membrane subunit b/b'